jgi:hypothetical protein
MQKTGVFVPIPYISASMDLLASCGASRFTREAGRLMISPRLLRLLLCLAPLKSLPSASPARGQGEAPLASGLAFVFAESLLPERSTLRTRCCAGVYEVMLDIVTPFDEAYLMRPLPQDLVLTRRLPRSRLRDLSPHRCLRLG